MKTIVTLSKALRIMLASGIGLANLVITPPALGATGMNGTNNSDNSASEQAPQSTITIGDRVWKDLNANGLQDSGEPGIAGLTVQLLDSGGNAVMCNTPGVLDTYLDEFRGDAVLNQSYGSIPWTTSWVMGGVVNVVDTGGNPSGALYFNASSSTNLATRAVDLSVFTDAPTFSFDYKTSAITSTFSVLYSVDGGASFITLTRITEASTAYKTLSFTLPLTATVANAQIRFSAGGTGSLVFIDNVQLSGPILSPQTAVTDASGVYAFTDADCVVGGNNYELRIDTNQFPLTGMALTTQNAGGAVSNDPNTDVTDSDAASATVGGVPVSQIVSITAPSSGTNTGYDFGYVIPEIGDRVWVDVNRNGLQDAGDLPLSNVLVWLFDSAGDPVICSTPGNFDTYFDAFNTLGVNNGSDGTLPWSTSWVHTSGSSVGGLGLAVYKNASVSGSATRAVDLSLFAPTPAVLTFNYRTNTGSTQQVVEYSTDGGASFTTLITMTSGTTWQPITTTLPASANVATARIRVRALLADSVVGYYDNFMITGQIGRPQQALTDANGYYVFSGTDCVEPNASYILRVDQNQPVLQGYSLTAQDAGGVTSNSPTGDVTDSDAAYTMIGGITQTAQIASVLAPAQGANYSYDFGYVMQQPTLRIDKVVKGGSSSEVFPITVVGPGGYVTQTTIATNAPITLVNVPEGAYTITEGDFPAAPNGYFWGAPSYMPNGNVVNVLNGKVTQMQIVNTLAQKSTMTTTAILTKSVIGSANSGPFDIALYDSNGNVTNTAIMSGVNTLNTLPFGAYTYTESSPGAGWVTTYTVNGVANTTNGLLAPTNAITAVAVAPGKIAGTVFADYNMDGAKATTDNGVADVTVTAYDRNGIAVGSTTTEVSGTYALTPTSAGPWRLEFTNLPAGYEPSRVNNGTQNDTSTQFISTVPANNANFGILKPCDYCQTNPNIAYAVARPGTAKDTTAPLGVFYRATYAAPSVGDTALSNKGEIGSVWGVAWSKSTKQLYVSAYVKRHVGMPTGLGASNPLGAIYMVNPTTSVTSFFIDITQLGASVGTLPGDADRDLTTPAAKSHDIEAFTKVGTTGIGDIDTSEDGKTLYVTSMNDKTIYAIDIASKMLIGSYPFGDGVVACTGGVFRPFGLKHHDGYLYAGGVCDANSSQALTDLTSFVYRLEGNTWVKQLEIPLNYVKGKTYSQFTNPEVRQFHPWVSNWDQFVAPYDIVNGLSPNTVSYPQPMLTDIEFDVNGDMILGYRDRSGDQVGSSQYGSNPGDTNVYSNMIGGDILRACVDSAGTYVLENAGACGGITGGGANGNLTTGGGPGGGEFYDGDNLSASHTENSMGAMAFLPGSGEIMLTLMDPQSFNTNGLRTLSNSTGAANNSYKVEASSFGKGNGMGDVELLCDFAPIEIGNRVWYDANQNGVQDPGELPIADVSVNLTTLSGTITATTDAAGLYYFRGEIAGGPYASTLRPFTAYTISINPQQTALKAYSLTLANTQAILGSTTSNDAILDTRDSDGYMVNGLATIYYQTGDWGQNNHGLDFGFTKPVTVASSLLNAFVGPIPDISVVKYTNGLDADSVTGPILEVGNPVTWTYVVRNTGTDVLRNVVLTDDKVALNNASECVPASSLSSFAVGAVMTCTKTGLAMLGQYVNTAIVTGTGTFNPSQQVTDTNPSHYFGVSVNPSPENSLVLTKTVVGSDFAGPFSVTLTNANGYVTNTTIMSGPNTLVGLPAGIYTVVELATGWSTTYTVDGVPSVGSGVLTLTNPISAAVTATGQITGTVYNDLESNGMRETTNIGVEGVMVTAYDRNGAIAGTATTIATGAYTLSTVASGLTGPYRLEFTNLPTGTQPSRVFTGTQNYGSTQFVSAPAGNINFAVHYPADYCQSNPLICTVVHISGGTNITSPVSTLLSVPLGSTGTTPAPRTLATKASIGSTWGIAYARGTGQIYSGAFVKRHVGLGPSGLGAIYKTATSPVTSTVLFADLASLGASVGTIDSNEARGLGAPNSANADTNAFDLVGRTGVGDIDLSEDESILYAVSLNDKTLYAISTNDGSLISSYPIPEPGGACVNGNWRPFALKVYHNEIYVGGICDAAVSGDASDLLAQVWKLNPLTGSFSNVIATSLDYTKGLAFNDTSTPGSTPCDSIRGWYPWVSTMPTPCVVASQNSTYIYPQPILSDLEFDYLGNMTLGFVDRFGHQMGYGQTQIDGTGFEYGIGAGDVLRACKNSAGNYVLENNGSCEGVIGGGVGDGEGPGGGEFYDGEFYGGFHKETSNGGLAQVPNTTRFVLTALDPVAVHSGGFVYMDSVTAAKSGGYEVFDGNAPPDFGKATGMGDVELLCNEAPIEIGNRVWFDVNANGVQDPGEPPISGVVVSLATVSGTITTTTNVSGTYYFTREASTGAFSNTLRTNTSYTISINPAQTALSAYSLTVANAQAIGGSTASDDPILDTRDSDAYLIGGQATIYYNTGSAGQNNHGLDFGFTKAAHAAMTITNSYGVDPVVKIGNRLWIESDTDGVASTGSITPVVGQVVMATSSTGVVYTATTDANGLYTITVPANDTYTVTTGTPAGTMPTVIVSTDGMGANDTNHVNSGTPVTVFTTDNLSIDFGFYVPALLGNFVWEDLNHNGVRDVGELGIPGVMVVLYNNSGTPAMTTTTNVSGAYTFTNVTSGTYTVRFKAPSWYRATMVQTEPFLVGSGGTIPPVSAGYWQPATIGDKVWLDGIVTGTQGVQDVGEPGVPGVAVALLDGSGNVISTTTTDSNGNYSFTNLISGTYAVSFTQPAGYVFVNPGVGGNPATDSNASTTTGASGPIVLPAGTSNLTVDAGISVPQLNLGSLVWHDGTNDGRYDGASTGDVPVSGVVVQLYQDTNGNGVFDPGTDVQVNQTTTDGTGSYLFANVPPSSGATTNYFVVITASNFMTGGVLNGLRPTTGMTVPFSTNIGDDNKNHGYGVGNFNGMNGQYVASSLITLITGSQPSMLHVAGDYNPTVDFGFIAAPTAIELGYFSAEQKCDVMEVKWQALSERDVVGYQIYRSETGRREDAQVVGEQMMYAQGAGTSYSLSDGAVKAGRTYTYWLEEVSASGAGRDAASISVTTSGCVVTLPDSP